MYSVGNVEILALHTVPLQVGAVRDAGRGRPRVMLRLNPDAAFVVGVKLAPDTAGGIVDRTAGASAAEISETDTSAGNRKVAPTATA